MPPTVVLGWPKTDYCLSLELAGARVHVVSPERTPVVTALDRCHGLLLTGGADVDPVYYGDPERHPTLSIVPGRDEYELALARGAMERGLPILAICRGIQLLNVAAGGTLVQDIPSQRPGPVNHAVREPATATAHQVRVVPESRLGAILQPEGARAIDVNSRHHQAVDRVAPGFVVSAVAPDGMVEAIERPAGPFCVGVQWHPENYWATGTFASLFRAFVTACEESRISS
jgi:putative glutamine amidotransferase